MTPNDFEIGLLLFILGMISLIIRKHEDDDDWSNPT